MAGIRVTADQRRYIPNTSRLEVLDAAEGRSDASGRFSLSFEPRTQHWIELHVREAPWTHQLWNRSKLAPGHVEDLGDIVLHEAAGIRGAIFDFRGAPIHRDWNVRATRKPASEGAGEGASAVRHLRSEAPPEGAPSYSIDGCSAGRYALTACFDDEVFARAEVELHAGEVAQVDLHQSGERDYWSEVHVRVSVTRPRPRPPLAHLQLVLADGTVRAGSSAREKGEVITFSDVPRGSHALAIDAPLYRPWRIEGVEPGPRKFEAELDGRSTLVLRVVDARTAEPLEAIAWSLHEFRCPSGEDGGIVGEQIEGNFHHYPAGRVEIHEIPGDLQHLVLPRGYSQMKIATAALQPGEEREVLVQARRALPIAGRVVDAVSNAPIAEARVALIARAKVNDSEDAKFVSLHGDSDRPELVRREVQQVRSDETGRFRLQAPEGGSWIVLAQPPFPRKLGLDVEDFRFPAGARKDVEVREDQPVPEIELRLARSALFQGRLILPAGVSLPPAFVLLRRAANEGEGRRASALHSSVDLEHRFRFEGVPPGRREVWIGYPADSATERRHRDMPPEFPRENAVTQLLGEVELFSGRTLERDFDVSAHLPATVEVALELTGGDPSSIELQCVRAGQGTNEEQVLTIRGDAQGLFRTSAIVGGAWSFSLRPASAEWCHPLLEGLSPSAGELQRLHAHVQLVRASIELRSPDGAALAGAHLRIEPARSTPAASRYRMVERKTDTAGRIALELPAGSYRIRCTAPGTAPAQPLDAELVWPPRDPAIVALRAGR